MGIVQVVTTLVDKLKGDLANVDINKVEQVIAYLYKYGYLGKIAQHQLTLADVGQALIDFHNFVGHKEGGDLITPTTLAIMAMPRCAYPDVLPARSTFAKWGTNNLTYCIIAREAGIDPNVWDAQISQAFANWAAVTPLTFTRITDQKTANLIISMGQGAKDQFDGPSGVLAWAQLPASAGFMGQLLMEFDADETWLTDPSKQGILQENVACHEFGHLLGLEHSQVQSALMAPFYNVKITKPQQNDDVSRIQALYGQPTGTPVPTPVPTPTPTPPAPTGSDEYVIHVKGEITIPGYRVTKLA